MNRKDIAQETLAIQKQGYYDYNSSKIDFSAAQRASEESSFLLTPEKGNQIIDDYPPPLSGDFPSYKVINCSTVDAIIDMRNEGNAPAVLNFASAKNPGGGFLNGAMAQEEALAATSGLYSSLLRHDTFYSYNRSRKTMMYSNHAIFSPDVVFFRNGNFELLEAPVTASVLTLPAVNMGQVRLKGEDPSEAKKVMKDRMRLSLAVFTSQKCKHLILGAFGCGIFLNDPKDVAVWWKALLEAEGYGYFFEEIHFAILDGSGKTIAPFEEQFAIS